MRAFRIRRLLLVLVVLSFIVSQAEHADEEESPQCATLQVQAPEDGESGVPTFVSAQPSILVDVRTCQAPSLLPRENAAFGAHVTALISQAHFPASAVTDGITDVENNGWAYIGDLDRAQITLTVQDKAEVSRLAIVSGVGWPDHHVTSFRVWYSSDQYGEDSWTPLPSLRPPPGGEDAVTVHEDGVTVTVSQPSTELVLAFAPSSLSRLRIKVEGSDAKENGNAIVNEVELLTDDGANGWDAVTMEVVVDGDLHATSRLSFVKDPRLGSEGEDAMGGMHRVWLPQVSGLHEVEVRLSAPVDQSLFGLYEKLGAGLSTWVSFPYQGYVFGRAMLPFVKLGAAGWQCLGASPLDNSTGACWVQPFDTWHSSLEVLPYTDQQDHVRCMEWGQRGWRRYCMSICDVDSNGEARCCDLDSYAEPRRSAGYIGLTCLPDGDYKLIVRFWDMYKVYTSKHEVPIRIDRTDIGLWYHKAEGSTSGSYLDLVERSQGQHDSVSDEARRDEERERENLVARIDELVQQCTCGATDWTQETRRPLPQCCQSIEVQVGSGASQEERVRAVAATVARGLLSQHRIVIPIGTLQDWEGSLSVLARPRDPEAAQEPQRFAEDQVEASQLEDGSGLEAAISELSVQIGARLPHMSEPSGRESWLLAQILGYVFNLNRRGQAALRNKAHTFLQPCVGMLLPEALLEAPVWPTLLADTLADTAVVQPKTILVVGEDSSKAMVLRAIRGAGSSAAVLENLQIVVLQPQKKAENPQSRDRNPHDSELQSPSISVVDFVLLSQCQTLMLDASLPGSPLLSSLSSFLQPSPPLLLFPPPPA